MVFFYLFFYFANGVLNTLTVSSIDKWDLTRKELRQYDTKLHQMLRFHFWRSGKNAVYFIAITPRSIMTRSGITC